MVEPSVLGEPSEEDVARAFSAYDLEGTGNIATVQVGDLMRDLGMLLNPQQLLQAEAQLDMHLTGLVSFGEFLLWWRG